MKVIALAAIWFATPFLVPAQVDEDDLRTLLLKNETASIEKRLDDVQTRFEQGLVTEQQLKAAFRPFERYDSTAATNLAGWVSASPKSYVAHLAYGVYLSSVGGAWRGSDYIDKVPKKNLDNAIWYWTRAREELGASLALSGKPYLSLYRLLYLSMDTGKPDDGRFYLDQANRALPSNALAREAYVESLLPKWGGSYDALEAFIAESSAAGVAVPILLQMEAIEEDDVGMNFQNGGRHAEALDHFHHALTLAKDAGDDFSYNFLGSSRYYTGLPRRCRC